MVRTTGPALTVGAAALLLALLTVPNAARAQPFLDLELPVDERVEDVVRRLTLRQKAQVLNHRGPTVTIDGFPLRADQWNQCLNGVKWDRPTTVFPICVAMAATWDPELVHEIAAILSDEARAIYNGWHLDPRAPGEHKGLIYRAPVINIGRNPYWGRNHEAWGEDPYLTGRMAVSYVRGLQGDDPRYLKLAATLKHFAVNNVETDRTRLNAVVPERCLREYWLPHFRDAVVEGGAQSVMASYNAINGTPNNINRWLLTGVLKNEWGHKGFVVSDLGGVRTMVSGHGRGQMNYVDAVAQSVMAGCDFSDKEYEDNIPLAVREGKLTEVRLNDAVARVLRVRFRLGEFDPFLAVPYSKIAPDVICSAKHRAVSLKAAQKAIVLLQNRDRLLPLDRTKLTRIAVLGPLADVVLMNNYNGTVGQTVTPLEGIKDRVDSGVEVLHATGTDVLEGVKTRVDKERGFSGGASVKLEANGPGEFIEFGIEVAAAGRYEMKLQYKSFPSRGTFQLSVNGAHQGQPLDMYAAPGSYERFANFGARDLAAGKHHFRFTAVGKNAASTSWTGHFDKLLLSDANEMTYELENAALTTGGARSCITEAAATAGEADIAVVFVGTDRRIEQEGQDRESLGLPGRQEELVKAVLAANPRTVVVQMSAGPLTVPWLKDNIPAMLQAWWPGEEGGHAIADVLFGDVNPAGRLPHTVYASEDQLPPLDQYDVAQGFTYMFVRGTPLYPFGHGLSYSSFEYSNPRASSQNVPPGGLLAVSVEVRNASSLSGDEVVQLYITPPRAVANRPRKMLRGFQRVTLQPHAKKEVTFTVTVDSLAFWDEDKYAFAVDLGTYGIEIGASSADIRMTTSFDVEQ